MKKQFLKPISEIFKKEKNVIQYLNKSAKSKKNSAETIMISYDFQSGSYIKVVKKNFSFNEKYTQAIADVMVELKMEYQSILEVGVGEATTLANLIPKLKIKPKKIYGFDLAWSRIRYAIEYAKKRGLNNAFLFMGDLFNMPLADNSIDIVYTSHSIEPNGGREKEALLELIRITRKYLILLEPAYEFASPKAKKRMKKHGYIRNLHSVAVSLGLNVVEHRLFDVYFNQLNPTGIMIIEKNSKKIKPISNPLICPITKTPLKLIKNSYFSDEGLLAYPIIDKVPCLLEDNAVVETHYRDKFKN